MSYHLWVMRTRVFAIAFLLNAAWEVTQASWYSGERQSLVMTFLHCLPAIVLDALFTLAIYLILLHWRGRTLAQLTRLGLLLLGVIGGTTAVVVELIALSFGWWSYGASMPLVPKLDVGLLPVMQLGFLTPLTFLLLRDLLRPTLR